MRVRRLRLGNRGVQPPRGPALKIATAYVRTYKLLPKMRNLEAFRFPHLRKASSEEAFRNIERSLLHRRKKPSDLRRSAKLCRKRKYGKNVPKGGIFCKDVYRISATLCAMGKLPVCNMWCLRNLQLAYCTDIHT